MVLNLNLFNLGEQYSILVYDILRVITVQLILHIMLCITDKKRYSFFDKDFFKSIIFVSAGVSVFWLIIANVLSLLGGNDNSETDEE